MRYPNPFDDIEGWEKQFDLFEREKETLDMKPIKLEKINEVLEKVGILLIVHTWEGPGPWEPTKLEFVTVKDFEIRCEKRKRNQNGNK